MGAVTTNEGQHFLDRVREHFAAAFVRFDFEEVGATDKATYSELTAQNRSVALRITLDNRDNRVFVRISRLTDSQIPAIVIFAPKSVAEVREFELGMVLWCAGWDRSRANSFGELDTAAPDPIDTAVRENADMLEEHAAAILQGDPDAWDRIAHLVIYRDMA